MKCIVCGQRKGKRSCPAKNSLICAQCCGEKRVIEIDCPPDCPHLTTGHSYQLSRVYLAVLEQLPPTKQRKFMETLQSSPILIGGVERMIVSSAADVSALRDSDILEAVSTVVETYRTEQKGLIYEHSTPNPLAQSLTREIRNFLEDVRKENEENSQSIPSHVFLDCLEFVQATIQLHLSPSGEWGKYLDFATRNHPDFHGKPATNRLIVP